MTDDSLVGGRGALARPDEPVVAGSEPVDRPRARQAVVAAAVGYGLDGLDLLILSFALSSIMVDFRLSAAEAGWFTSLTLIGAVVGGLGFGLLADRFGRARMLTWSVLLFAVFTGLSSLAVGPIDFGVYRFVAGIGVGGEFGIGMSLAAEAVPAHWRARATSWVAIGFQVGVLIAALISAPVIAGFGWRGLFVVGIVPALVAYVMRRRLRESSRFEATSEVIRTLPKSAPLRLLIVDREAVRVTIAMIVLTSVQNFGYFGIITWLPSYVSVHLHLGVAAGALWTAVTVLGMICGILVFGQIADRVGRRAAFWSFQLGAAVSLLVYSQLTGPVSLLVGGFVMGVFANGMLGGYGALMAELYPAAARATAQNVLFNIGRGIGGLAPVVIATIASAHGFGYALALLPLIYLLAFVAMFLVPDRRKAVL